jgi:uncharacterized membrane protein
MSQSQCATDVKALDSTGECGTCPVNVGTIERYVSGFAGGMFVLEGLFHGGARGLLTAAIGGGLLYRGWTGHCSMYQALEIDTADRRSSNTSVPAKHGARIECSVSIDAPTERLYRHWRVLSNLPKLAPHLESVREIDPAHSRWIARTPLGGTVAWDAEIIEDRLGEIISWRSLPGSEVDSAGSIRFQSLGDLDQTLLTLSLKYNPPGGTVAAKVAEFLGMGVEEEVFEALHQFKREIETEQAAVPAAVRHTDSRFTNS